MLAGVSDRRKARSVPVIREHVAEQKSKATKTRKVSKPDLEMHFVCIE
jgi:hypothetical protein